MMMPHEKKDGDDDKNGRGPLVPPLTFDCLLNCLDGVERADGIFTIITTNDLTQDRPGAGPAAAAARTARPSSSPRGRAGSTRRSN